MLIKSYLTNHEIVWDLKWQNFNTEYWILVEKKEYILDNPRFICVYTRLNSDANVKSENEVVSVSGISDYVIDNLIIMNARADGQWNSSAQIQFLI